MSELMGGKAKFRATIGLSDKRKGEIQLVKLKQGDNSVGQYTWVEYDQSRMRNLIKGDVIDFTAIVLVYDGIDEYEGGVVKKAKLTQIRSIERVS